MNIKNQIPSFIFLISSFILGSQHLFGCTDFVVKAKDNSLVNGRSMEFALDFGSKVIFYPRGIRHVSKTPNGNQGLTWVSKYGFIGIDALDLGFPIDGMNEKGLSVGFLWLPGTVYQSVTPENEQRAVVLEDLGNWILGNFDNVLDLKKEMQKIVVWSHSFPQINGEAPLHIAIHDLQDQHLVVEFIDGKMIFHDNPNTVLTNAPTFDWHLTNLTNYIHLQPVNFETRQFGGMTLTSNGQGSGFLGMPGDWTPPSRFIRASFLRYYAEKINSSSEAVIQALHLLNSVDIPKGDIRIKEGSNESDYTQWVVIKDMTNQRMYFRSYNNLNLAFVDFKKLDFSSEGTKQAFSISSPVENLELTSKLHNKDKK